MDIAIRDYRIQLLRTKKALEHALDAVNESLCNVLSSDERQQDCEFEAMFRFIDEAHHGVTRLLSRLDSAELATNAILDKLTIVVDTATVKLEEDMESDT